MERLSPQISTPLARPVSYMSRGRPLIQKSEYPQTPGQALVIYKLAFQMSWDAGFDSTLKLQKASKEQQSKPKSESTEYWQKLVDLSYILSENCTMDLELAESISKELDIDSMDDAAYIQAHVVMEALEQLSDHNETAVEYPLYDNVKKYGLDVSLEDQPATTFTPIQVYLAPFDHRVVSPYLNAKVSTVDYSFPDTPGRAQSCVFIPRWDKVKEPTQGQRAYVNAVIHTTAEAFPADFVFRQLSAHEMWSRLVAQRAGLKFYGSISDAYNMVLESSSKELGGMLQQVEKVEPEVLFERFQNLQKTQKDIKHWQSRSGPQYAEFIEAVVSQCVDRMSNVLNAAPLQMLTSRQFTFGTDFDISIRGMIEQKAVLHHFYTLEEDRKVAFLRPIIAQRLLHYRRCGDFYQYLKDSIITPKQEQNQYSGSILFDDSEDREAVSKKEMRSTGLQNQLQSLTKELCKAALQQHQELLRVILQSPHALTYVVAQFQALEGKLSELLVRPVCGCYACNLCSLSDTFDFADRIFPVVQLRSSKQHSEGGLLTYTLSPKEFSERVLGLDYTQELQRICPYCQVFARKALDDLGCLLRFSDQSPSWAPRKIAMKPSKSGRKNPTPNVAMQQILLYCLSAPTFLQYPASYGAIADLPAIVLSSQHRPGEKFDPRCELFLAFFKNPALQGTAGSRPASLGWEDTSPQEELHNVHRTCPVTQNFIIGRYMAQYYRVQFLEPPAKALHDCSALELACWLWPRQELASLGDTQQPFSQDVILTQDFKTLPGFSIQLKGLASLPIVKKYKGKATTEPLKQRKASAIFKSKVGPKRLGLSDQAFLSKLFKAFGDDEGRPMACRVETESPGEELESTETQSLEEGEDFFCEEEEEVEVEW